MTKELAEQLFSAVVIGSSDDGLVKIEYSLKSGFMNAYLDPSLNVSDLNNLGASFVKAANNAMIELTYLMMDAQQQPGTDVLEYELDTELDPKKFN